MNEQMIEEAKALSEDFALGFQSDAVQFLHREKDIWSELGNAPFGEGLRDNLKEFAKHLRAKNVSGLVLIIPDDQILYTDLNLPEMGDTETSLRAGLDGLTPYAVDDLAYDFAPADAAPGTRVKVAAVARQTLQEAEDFAVSHGFAPNRFIAAPASDQFPREADFGTTELAAEWALAAVELAEIEGIDLFMDMPAMPPAPEALASAASGKRPSSASDQRKSVNTPPEPITREMSEDKAKPGAETPELAGAASLSPVLSRIVPHIMPAPRVSGPAIGVSVNSETIILSGDSSDEAPEIVHAVPEAEEDHIPASDMPKTAKPLSARARAFHERAGLARDARAVPGTARSGTTAGGYRSGFIGALPLIGILILGLGILAVMTGRDTSTPSDSASVTEEQELAAKENSPAFTTETKDSVVTGIAVTEAETAEADDKKSAAVTSPAVTDSGSPAASRTASPLPVDISQETQQTNVTKPSQINPEPDIRDADQGEAASAVRDSAIAAAVNEAYSTGPISENPEPEGATSFAPTHAETGVQPSEVPPSLVLPVPRPPKNTPVSRPESTAIPAPESSGSVRKTDRNGLSHSVRPAERPAAIADHKAPPPKTTLVPRTQKPARARPDSSPAQVSREIEHSDRPAQRPDNEGRVPAAAPVAARNPGAPESSTLTRSVRPQTAPSRSEPNVSPPDPRPSVPRSPLPFGQRRQPEPAGLRPPPKPATGLSIQGAALQSQPAPRHLAMFSVRGHDAMLDKLARPWLRVTVEQMPVVRTAQVRPARKPGARPTAVDAAVAEAIGSSPPVAKASTSGVAQAPEASANKLNHSSRPARRPRLITKNTGVAGASTAGISRATSAAVEGAVAAAISGESDDRKRGAGLTLVRSARPMSKGQRPGNNSNSGNDTDRAVAAALDGKIAPDGTLSPEPERTSGESKAAAEAEALAERRKLDDELQRQAEQRMRERAAADARADAQEKAAADARARAQAAAEAAAAARKRQVYRPPEVDNEPEISSAERDTTSATVVGASTTRGIDLNATQLIGTVGAGKASRGLVRLRNGKIVTVRLGDKINGGQITQIGNGGLYYVRSGKKYSLPILNGR